MSERSFTVGQWVIFKPDSRTLGLQVMVENLTPGQRYKISEVRETGGQTYIAVEGHPSAGGGLHSSAFVAA